METDGEWKRQTTNYLLSSSSKDQNTRPLQVLTSKAQKKGETKGNISKLMIIPCMMKLGPRGPVLPLQTLIIDNCTETQGWWGNWYLNTLATGFEKILSCH